MIAVIKSDVRVEQNRKAETSSVPGLRPSERRDIVPLNGVPTRSTSTIPEQFDVMVTNACNARCAFCVQEATFKSAQGSNERFMGALKCHFREFYESGGRRVVITGGEPLLDLQRVLDVLKELAQYPDLTVKALYTNGERLVHSLPGSGSYADALAHGGLGCVNLSVHHDDEEVNNRIFALPEKADTESITSHLRTCGLPFRFNLTLQRGGIECFADLVRYAKWAFSLGAQDIYVRELFRFAFTEPKCASDREPLGYCLTRRVSAAKLVQQMKEDRQFTLLRTSEEKLREKIETEFLHVPFGRRIFISSLTIGTESNSGMPYLVLMADGNLYRGWLDSEDRISSMRSANLGG